jgi:general secretion pathway protein J
MTRRPDAGFTLIEVLVSLALFALIAGAGLSVLDQVLRAQSQTETKLDQLGATQRMMHLVARDLATATPGSVIGDAASLTLMRSGTEGPLTITYALAGENLTRALPTTAQTLLTDTRAIAFQYLDGAGQWQAIWPPSTAPDLRAIAITLDTPMGSLRRIIPLPRTLPP